MKVADKARLKDKVVKLLNQTYSTAGYLGSSYNNGHAFSKPDALALLFLVEGVKEVGCHIQYHAGRKNELTALMPWRNNLKVTCKNPQQAREMFIVCKLLFTEIHCGWMRDSEFGLGVPQEHMEKVTELISGFYCMRGDVKRILKLKTT